MKTSAIPKTKVEAGRRELYDRALKARQKADPDARLSSYIREALDRAAAKDLGMSYSEFQAKVLTVRPRDF